MKNLNNSIETYIAEDNPCYALQITGEWGVGKTFTIKNILKDNMYYISIFGLEKIEDVYSSIFYSMYENKANKTIRNFSNLIKDIKFSFQGLNIPLGSGADFLIKSIIKDKIKNDKVIVIDDIERSSIGQSEIFGFISNCLENHKCKIILLMNENAINHNNDLIEKTIGRKIKISANFQGAYDDFIKSHLTKKNLSILKDNVIDIFNKMECQSLRILKRVIFELDMICKCIDNNQLSNAQSEIKPNLIVFSALSILIKQGKIEAKDLAHRKNSISYYFSSEEDNNKEGNYAKAYAQLYKQLGDDINLTSDFLSDNVLIDILGNGFFLSSEIKLSINSYINNKEGKIIPWIVIYKLYQYNDQAVHDAILQIDNIFKTKSKQDLGSVLHLISAIYYIEELFCESINIANLNKYIFKYIDYLYKNTNCFLNDGSNVWFNHIFGNSHGFEYYSKENDKYNHVVDVIKKKVVHYTNKKINDIGLELNTLFHNNTELFFEFIEKHFKENTIYTNKPILKNININKLAIKLMKLNYFDYDRIYHFFLNRYSKGQWYNDLKEENIWFISLINTLKIINKKNKITLSKIRVNGFINRLEYIIN